MRDFRSEKHIFLFKKRWYVTIGGNFENYLTIMHVFILLTIMHNIIISFLVRSITKSHPAS